MQTVFTIANVYSPNQEQLQFLSSVTVCLESFGAGNLILGGDLNTPLILRLDSSMGNSPLLPTALTKICFHLSQLTLTDVCRMLHPTKRDYTYFSADHNSYSRIDYILISQSLLDFDPSRPFDWSVVMV